MAKNILYRSVEEQNSEFKIVGEPHFRQQACTFVDQQIRFTYRGVEEAGIALWNNMGVPPYAPANIAFLPFNQDIEATDRLPLNRTFRDVKWLPVGSDTAVSVQVEEQLELRTLLCTSRSREVLERVSLPKTLDEYDWYSNGNAISYEDVQTSFTRGVAGGDYYVDLPLVRNGRFLLSYGHNTEFNECPLISHASQQSIRFTFDWNDGKFKFPGGGVTLNTAYIVFHATGVQDNIIAHKDFRMFIPPLETQAVNAAGYCVFGPSNGNTRIGVRTDGYVPVYLTFEDLQADQQINRFENAIIRINNAGVQSNHYISQLIKNGYLYIPIPYFQIPFGRTTLARVPPILNGHVANAATVPPTPLYRGIYSISSNACTPFSYNEFDNLGAGEIVHLGVAQRVGDTAVPAQRVYMRIHTLDAAITYGGNAVQRHAFYVQFPSALPVGFEAEPNRQFYAECTVMRGAPVVATQIRLTGITPDLGAPLALSWSVLNAAELVVYNAQNVVGNYPQPAAGTRQVIVVYVQEEEVSPAPPQVGLPGSEMIAAAQPLTPIAQFDAVVGQDRNTIPVIVLLDEDAAEQPYIRGGFTLTQHEPFYNFPSGLCSYPDVKEPFSKLPKFLPLLIQDSTTSFVRSTDDLPRCIRLKDPVSRDEYLTAELVGDCALGYYIQNDVEQAEKGVSTINLPIPRFELVQKMFTTVSASNPVELVWTTSHGIPSFFMFRIKQNIGPKSYVSAKHYFAKIDSATLEIYGETSRFLTTVNHRQLREITRQNCNSIADKHEYIVLLSAENLGTFNDPKQEERLEFRFTLKEISQPVELVAVTKQLMITPIYRDTQALRGTLEHITTQNFYL